MGKGILAVGFPDSSHVQPGSPLSQRVEEDKANLRQLIYSSGELVYLDRGIQDQFYFVISVCIGCLCILWAYIMLK